MRHFVSVAAGLFAVGLVLCTASAAHCEIFVIESSAPSLKAGSELGDGERLAVPEGTVVRILLPSNKTLSVKGPYEGTVADIGKGKLDSSGMISWLRSFLKTGGSNENVPGATRSIAAKPAAVRAAFSWTDIATGTDSTVCVPSGQVPQLRRGVSGKADHVTVVDRDKAARGEAAWTAGSDTTAWPSSLPIRDGAAYDLLVPDRPKRTLMLHVLPVAPEEADVLGVLHARGCKAQFDAWLRDNSVRRR